jgi:hypothetical protein
VVNDVGMDAHGGTLTPGGTILIAGASAGPNATSNVKRGGTPASPSDGRSLRRQADSVMSGLL